MFRTKCNLVSVCMCIVFAGAGVTVRAADLPDNLFLKEPPPGALNVAELKKTAKEGDEVVLRGQIGGQPKDVFNASRAMVMVADMKLKACSLIPGDACETPWDFCCVPVNEKLASLAIVQVVDEKGRPVKTTLKTNGLDHLSVVVVKGKVAKNEAGNLIVNATGIFVESKPNK